MTVEKKGVIQESSTRRPSPDPSVRNRNLRPISAMLGSMLRDKDPLQMLNVDKLVIMQFSFSSNMKGGLQ